MASLTYKGILILNEWEKTLGASFCLLGEYFQAIAESRAAALEEAATKLEHSANNYEDGCDPLEWRYAAETVRALAKGDGTGGGSER
jgi:hypothetical protein